MGISPQPLLISNYRISPEWLEQLKLVSNSPLLIHTPLGQVTINQGEFITPEMEGEQQVQLFLQPSASNPGHYEVLASIRPVEVDTTLAAFRRSLLLVIPITVVLAAGFGFLLIWQMLKPVNEIARAAREIKEKDLSRRIEVQNQDELGKLAVTLNQTFERLEHAFQRERQFTSDASHELRTPLSIMQSEATLALKKDRSQEEYRKSLVSISQEIAHMSSITGKLLFLSRLDNGRDKLNLTAVNLSDLLADLASNIEALCDEKSLLFGSSLADNIFIKGDSVKLRELFLNLLDNAIKFTPPGGRIGFFLKKEDQAVVEVVDTGIGISEEHLPHIFERFYRIEKTSSLENNGSGLGLAICKQIAELHQGHISVRSQTGQGSTFTVTIPLVNG
jgi:heavy metal sensor kinase